ncbi:MAG: hypothetical protein K2G58_00285, partial [Alistipes sp.]|nr:hypothetical protein [Alistipes sp.]
MFFSLVSGRIFRKALATPSEPDILTGFVSRSVTSRVVAVTKRRPCRDKMTARYNMVGNNDVAANRTTCYRTNKKISYLCAAMSEFIVSSRKYRP